MGIWGNKLSDNDLYADVYGEFFELFNGGMEVSKVTGKLIRSNKEFINDPDESNNFWFALAQAQWDCGALEPGVFETVKTIIESDKELTLQRELGSDEKAISKRKTLLEKFIVQLATPNIKPKKRKKQSAGPPIFAKGDCLALKFTDETYGGAIILEVASVKKAQCYLVGITRIRQTVKPTKNEFEDAEILVLNFRNWDDRVCISWMFYSESIDKSIFEIVEVVDQLEVQTSFSVDSTKFSMGGNWNIWVVGIAEQQFAHESEHPRSELRIMMSDAIKAGNNDR